MGNYRLSGYVTISVYTDVNAESLEEAIGIASERSIEPYSYGENGQAKYVWVNEEYDGEVFNINEE